MAQRRKNKGNRTRKYTRLILWAGVFVVVFLFLLWGTREKEHETTDTLAVSFGDEESSLPTCHVYQDKMPHYDGEDILVLNEDQPNFTKHDIESITGETYAPFDSLGRCGSAVARLDASMMPKDKTRPSTGMIRPSGFINRKYEGIIDDLYLYNRCHLIAYGLTAKNLEEGLVTGTRHLNKDLMAGYEIMVMKWLEENPEKHVLYRVTPYFERKELVCRGVEMEAYSVEDSGRGLSFHVFLYNVQPGIEIDYETGESTLE